MKQITCNIKVNTKQETRGFACQYTVRKIISIVDEKNKFTDVFGRKYTSWLEGLRTACTTTLPPPSLVLELGGMTEHACAYVTSSKYLISGDVTFGDDVLLLQTGFEAEVAGGVYISVVDTMATDLVAALRVILHLQQSRDKFRHEILDRLKTQPRHSDAVQPSLFIFLCSLCILNSVTN